MDHHTGSGAQGDVGGYQKMETISQDIQLVSEATLKEISKGPLVNFVLSCEDADKVSRLWQSLLRTFSTASTSNTHNTASCNTVSAFLDTALTSKCEETRKLAWSHETWSSVFETYMTRYKDSSPKSMKQILECLVGLFNKNPQETDKDAIRSKIAHATIPSIILGEPRSRLKASFVSLETLVRKNAISPDQLISMVENWLLENRERWISLLQQDCKVLSIDVPRFLGNAPSPESKKVVAEILLLRLLAQSKTPELAASSGDLMAVFFQKLKSSRTSPLSSQEDPQDISSVWVTPVRHLALQNLDNLELMSNYTLQPLFNIDPIGFRAFLDKLHLKNLLVGDMSEAPLPELTLLFASLQMAKKIGLVHEDPFVLLTLLLEYIPRAGTSSTEAQDAIVLKSEVIGQFLFHREHSIKIAALSLLITAPATTKPVSSATIRAILRGLPSMHSESADPYARGEILSLIRKLIPRLKGGILSEDESFAETKISQSRRHQPKFARDDSQTRKCLQEYLELLKDDLRPTASYPRHIMGLKTLIHLLESGLDARHAGHIATKQVGNVTKWRVNVEVFEPGLLRLLVDLLLDAYEEVRATSLTLLNLFPQDVLLSGYRQLGSNKKQEKPQLVDALNRAEQLASNTSRADHADTVARLYHIFFTAADDSSSEATENWWETKQGVVDIILKKLEEKLSLTGGLFNSSMRDAPLHGYVSALRYIVQTPDFHLLISTAQTGYKAWKTMHERIVFVCGKIWIEVKPVLCIDSPEGHTDDPIEDLTVGPKDILSYSWRALRESSLLLYATLANRTYGPKGEIGLTKSDYETIGVTSFTQLAELRHRGAFSTVSQTFATCCLRCGQSNDPEIASLPQQWYQEARKIIFETASKLTRRSAGLPALATGILSSNPGGPLFQEVIKELLEISHLPVQQDNDTQEMELPQVHALNCLKDIFTNTKLGAHTEPFIMSALNLSAEQLGSPVWNLRNSGLMLFRALLTRMCRKGTGLGFGGSSGSEPGSRISFQKYPGLIQLLSDLLSSSDARNNAAYGDHAMVTERVFPALELIAEKIPNVYDTDDAMLLGLVREQLKSPVWGIREHAARVYASLLNRPGILKDIQTLLEIDRDSKSQDYLHGKALSIKYALRRFGSASLSFWNEHISAVCASLRQIFATLFPVAESPYVANTLLEILSESAEKSFESGTEDKISMTLCYIYDSYEFQDILEYLFDASNPSQKYLGTSRACSMLRRSLPLVGVLQMLAEGELNELEPFIKTVSKFDPNAGVWLLERIQYIIGTKDKHRKTLLQLYPSIILGDCPEDVKGSAISYLASILENLLDFHQDKYNDVDLPWDALDRQINSKPSGEVWNRDRSDAAIRLQGCLLAAKAISNQGQISETDIRRWATKLRFAMQEETEFTTRCAAVASLTAFGRALRSNSKAPLVDQMYLEIYLILFDMLSDDDEDLRDIAAGTASWVVSYSSVAPSKAVALSPLNASQLLADFMVDNYSDSQLLSTSAIRYITGQELKISGSAEPTKLASVEAQITELRKESTILFEEERQNLFTEEIREVDIWSGRLLRLRENAFNAPAVKETSRWVSEGLSYMADIMDHDSGQDGLVGWVSKPETFTLGVRLISLAAVLVSGEFAASGYLHEDQSVLRAKLQRVLDNGKKALVHDNWVSRMQDALGGQG
ncbi:putative death-receptor fusion protein-domain-containing protein [Aspergillus coremiiformis]|uniref:Putative death-receptor fusion protein-domain-containing protein n=1 Tax=Aspergillus coremiiformis TaxID=138285 RepID=A0A5N6ZFD1_9EURO|nr:putative death-receptor fusion protein-domain-containing protein [Aspergillus coremiiformis]